MKNLLQITSAGEDLLGTVDDGTNRLFINDTEIASSAWTGTGSYTGSFSGHTITIAKIADTSGNVAIRKTGTYTYELYDQKVNEYLPLTGGTLTGNLYMPNGYGNGIGGGYSKFVTRSEIGAGSSNDLMFTVPRLAYWDIGASDVWNADTAQKWLKYVASHYGSQLRTDRMVCGEVVAGTRIFIIGSAYDWTDVVNGMPKYSWFNGSRFDFRGCTFVSNNGAFYYHGESGYLITNTLPTISVPNNSVTVLGTQTLGAGNWLVIGSINWATNGSGYRQVSFANGANPSRMDFVTAAPANASGKQSAQQIVKIFASDNEQTVTLYGLQNSGSALTVYPYIQAINLG